MSRSYAKEDDLIWMDLIHSRVGESFHKQQICVEGQGWTIVNESIEKIELSTSSYNPYTAIYVNKLDIEKNGVRQVMMYWFMLKRFGSSNAVTMIRLSSPVDNDYVQTATFMSQFIEKQLFPVMYENVGNTLTMVETLIYGNKKTGPVVLFLALLLPLILIFNSSIKKVLKKRK